VGRWLEGWRDLVVGARFLRDLPGHLRRPPLTVGEARAEVSRRLARRSDDLLRLVAAEVAARPRGLSASLLAHAGCEAGDLERSVRADGVEGALAGLLRSGVYLTGDEFKGRVAVRRGSATFEGGPDAIRNPRARFHVALRSSGSRGAGTPVLLDLAFVCDQAATTLAAYSAWGVDRASLATWEVPGGGALFRLLEFARMAQRPERWFSHLSLAEPSLHPRYRRSARALVWGSWLSGVALPAPVHAPYDDPAPIVDWFAETIRRGGTPLLFGFPSSAVRIAETALARSIDLAGGWVVVSGEPSTATRLATIRSAGLAPIVRYGSIETGALGYLCRRATRPDELHRLDDLHGFVHVETDSVEGLPRGAILVTSLRPSAPFLFLNTSMGDRAERASGACGCALEQLGWRERIHTVRSFEKLTGAGMTFRDADLIELLERELPQRFGGGPSDWQLVEDESPSGAPRIRLLVDSGAGEFDADEARAAFLAGLAAASPAAQTMSLVWRDAGLPEIERRPPLRARTGKVLHLYVDRT